jgi:hypothetical protein
MTADFAGPSRFNHVAMSVPADLLDEGGRADICAFFEEVFGWEELPTMTIDRRRLILSVFSFDQFIFVIADDEPMRAAPGDHFGVAVDSLAELNAVLDRARLFQNADGRVEIVDYEVEDHEVLKVHNFYVRFLLPLMVEVQYFEMTG